MAVAEGGRLKFALGVFQIHAVAIAALAKLSKNWSNFLYVALLASVAA